MCEPTTLMMASLAISALTAAKTYDDGRSTANKQTDAIKRNDELQTMDAARQQSQLAAQGAEATNESVRSAQASMASLDAIAGEYGGGNSVNRGRSMLGIRSGESVATVKSNATNSLNENAASAYANRSRNLSQIGSVSRPSMMLAGLQIGSAAMDAYDRYDRYTTGKAAQDKAAKGIK